MPGFGIGTARQAAKPKTLREQAIDAFKRGDDQLGFQLLYTHFAIMPSAGSELTEKMAWNPGLRRPALGPRFAIGAIYNPPADFEGSPQPIGSKEAEEALASLTAPSNEGSGSGERKSRRLGDKRRTNNERGAGGPPGVGPPGALGAMPGANGMNGQNSAGPGETPADELDFYVGEYGNQLFDAIQSRLASGDYGLVLRDLMTEARQPVQRQPRENNNGFGGMPGAAGAPPGMGNPMPGGIAGAPPGIGAPPGMGVPPGAGNPMPGVGAGGEQGQAKDEPGEGPASLAPAIVWLGTGRSKDELLRSAGRAHADVLVAFEITIRPAKANAFVNNTTKVRVSMVKKDELLVNTSGLNNRDVIQAREKGKGDDPVEKDVAKIIETLDKTFTTTELPGAVTPERALARVQALVAQRPDDPLAVVVETRFYAEKGLLKQEDVLNIAAQALGDEKFAELLAKVPGAGAGQMIGGSVGFGGLLDLMRGVNSATGAAKGGPAKPGGGLGGLVPFGLPIPGLASSSGGAGKLPPAAGNLPPGANVPPGLNPVGANGQPGLNPVGANGQPGLNPVGGNVPPGINPGAANVPPMATP